LAGGAEVSSWEAGAENLAKGRTGDVQDWVAEVGMIKNIEEFGAKLQIEPLGDFGVFGDGEIGVHEIGTDDGVTTEVTKVASGQFRRRHSGSTGRDKSGFVGEPLRRISSSDDRTDYIRAHGERDARTGTDDEGRVERIAGLRLGDNTELPAGDEAVALERKLVETAEDKAMTGIEFGRAIIATRIIRVLQEVGFTSGERIVIERLGERVGSDKTQAM